MPGMNANHFANISFPALVPLCAFGSAFGPRGKLKLKLLHPYLSSAELHAFHFQSKALVQPSFPGDSNPAAGGDYAMPGQSMRLAEHADYKPSAPGKSGGAGHCSVTRDFAARDSHDGFANLDGIQRAGRQRAFRPCGLSLSPDGSDGSFCRHQ